MKNKTPDWIQELANEHADPVRGFYGPETAQWILSREQVLFLGGLRALLMQIAHPAVAHATRGHSHFYTDPMGRLERTFDIVHAMVFGSQAEAVQAATRLWNIHSRISGTLPDDIPGSGGRHYSATDSDILFWVYATLLDSTIAVTKYVLPQTDPALWVPFYEQSKIFARLCGVQERDIPTTLSDFHKKVAAVIDSSVITVTPDALHIKDALLKATPLLKIMRPYNQMVAARLLPQKLRVQFGMPLTPMRKVGNRINGAILRAVIPLLSPRVRYVPAYREAVKRCQSIDEQPIAVAKMG